MPALTTVDGPHDSTLRAVLAARRIPRPTPAAKLSGLKSLANSFQGIVRPRLGQAEIRQKRRSVGASDILRQRLVNLDDLLLDGIVPAD
jgi:hypothetical protein